jgi:DNA recombination protein RmuC
MDIIIYIAVGILAGALVSWLLTRSLFLARQGKILLEKQEELNALSSQNAVLHEKYQALERNMEEVKKAMLDTFKSAATDALSLNSKHFLDLARTQLESKVKETEGNLDQRKAAIEEMLKPVKESIDGYRKRIEELEKGSEKTFGQVTEMLANLQKTSSVLQKETGALVNALRNPRVRGRWGEIGLRRLVEYSGMLAHCDFSEQVVKEGEDFSMKPDMVINLPGNSHVVVDSKLPLDAYLEALETEDDAIRNNLLSKHARDLRDHIARLSKRQYWSQFQPAPDFVILYMEVESAFNAALLTDKNLLHDAMTNKIILATPTTLMVILKSVAMSWQQHNITENAIKIMDAAEELYQRIKTFSDHLEKVGSGLNSAVKSYNDAVGSWEGRILPTGRKLEQLKAAESTDKLQGMEKVDRPLRELKKPE